MCASMRTARQSSGSLADIGLPVIRFTCGPVLDNRIGSSNYRLTSVGPSRCVALPAGRPANNISTKAPVLSGNKSPATATYKLFSNQVSGLKV